MNAFGVLLGAITDEGDRKTFEALSGKYPALRAVVKEDDFTRLSEQAAHDRGTLDKWEKWRVDNWNDEHKMTTKEYARMQEVAAVRAELEAAKASGSGEAMNFTELDEYLKTKGVVTKSDLETELKPVKDGAAESVDKYAQAYGAIITKAIPLAVDHQRLYGKSLDLEDMFAKASKEGISNIEKAYEFYTSEDRQKKQEAEFAAKIEAARAEERQKVLQESALGEGGRIPVDSGNPELGHFQTRLQQQKSAAEKADQVVPDEVPLGQGIGRFVAQQYRKDQVAAQTA